MAHMVPLQLLTFLAALGTLLTALITMAHVVPLQLISTQAHSCKGLYPEEEQTSEVKTPQGYAQKKSKQVKSKQGDQKPLQLRPRCSAQHSQKTPQPLQQSLQQIHTVCVCV
jgi:hypothetical protein